MPVLNECWAATDAEGFVHVDIDLEQEFLFEPSAGEKARRRSSSVFGDDTPINPKSCKQVIIEVHY